MLKGKSGKLEGEKIMTGLFTLWEEENANGLVEFIRVSFPDFFLGIVIYILS